MSKPPFLNFRLMPHLMVGVTYGNLVGIGQFALDPLLKELSTKIFKSLLFCRNKLIKFYRLEN